jgi:hypothetical protein
VGFDPHEPEQRSRLCDALRAADISMGDLWLRYFSMSGSAGEYEVHAYVQGLISLPAVQRDLLAMAANEIIDETPALRAPYSDQMDGAGTDASDIPEDGNTAGRSSGGHPGKDTRGQDTEG